MFRNSSIVSHDDGRRQTLEDNDETRAAMERSPFWVSTKITLARNTCEPKHLTATSLLDPSTGALHMKPQALDAEPTGLYIYSRRALYQIFLQRRQ